jgi:formylmethanofuran dehydrogenase subunit E
VERIMGLPEPEFLSISEVFHRDVKMGLPTFDIKRCSKCGETTFTNKLTQTPDGRLLCVPCAETGKKA